MDLHVRTAGSGDAGTIAFLHGFPFDGSVWDRQISGLPPGWRGLAPDLRGFGRTPLAAAELPAGSDGVHAVAHPDEAVLTMDALASDVARLIERHAAGPTVVCALSMGGYVAFALRRLRPELIRGLVLMDTRAGADSEEARDNRRRMADTARRAGAESIATAMLPSLLAPATHERNPDVVARVRRMIEGTSPRTIIAALAGMAARPDSSPDLPAIDSPALVIVGAEDTITPPEDADAMAAAIPHARLVVVDGAGHLPGLEQPEPVNALISEFLTKL